MSALTVTTRETAAGLVLEVAGGLDYDTAPHLRGALQHIALSPGHLLVLDLADCAFCDSSGVSAFLAARNRALACDAGIALAGVPTAIARTLRTVGLDQVFSCHHDAHAAAAAWASQSKDREPGPVGGTLGTSDTPAPGKQVSGSH
ncbi:STAS domain-containing protein [Streptomyces sp. NPDC017993]|uniref:STAS domain-containing protein n=1 Tax=Streptomyces sp. NPDC017993 TaxID=3365027 RepID=UPI0037A4305B